jgi:hypothetical protein
MGHRVPQIDGWEPTDKMPATEALRRAADRGVASFETVGPTSQ